MSGATITTEKTCPCCRDLLPATDFYESSSSGGLYPYCKSCARAQSRIRTACRRGARSAYYQEYRACHVDELREYRHQYRSRNLAAIKKREHARRAKKLDTTPRETGESHAKL